MSYVIKSSEKLRKPGSESETKALLYLMNFRNDSNEIYYYVIDFFNDLTGMDRMAGKLWDLQSKGNHNVSPKALGKELVTLFKNYMSDLEFHAYIIFVGSVTGAVRVDPSIDVFDFANVKDAAKEQIKKGLIEEGKSKTYVNDEDLSDTNINSFLSQVLFVVDNDKKPSEYVKGLIKNHPNIMPKDDILTAIFNEIRDKQSAKKNVNVVENITIETTDEALNYCRHLTSNEIRLLAIQRIIQCNPLEKGITPSFVSIYSAWPPEIQKEKLEQCQAALCCALFNKNASDGFWGLFELIYKLVTDYPNDTVQQLFNRVRPRVEVIERCPNFDVESLKYFMAMVKDGIQQ